MLKDKHLQIIFTHLHPEWQYIDLAGEEYEEFAEAVMYLVCDYYRNKYYFNEGRRKNV